MLQDTPEEIPHIHLHKVNVSVYIYSKKGHKRKIAKNCEWCSPVQNSIIKTFYYGTLWLLEYSVVRFPHNDVTRCLT